MSTIDDLLFFRGLQSGGRPGVPRTVKKKARRSGRTPDGVHCLTPEMEAAQAKKREALKKKYRWDPERGCTVKIEN